MMRFRRWTFLSLGMLALTQAKQAHAQNYQTQSQEPTSEESAPLSFAAPRAHAKLVGPNPSYVGQMVVLDVEVLRDNRAANEDVPFFPELHVRDAIAVLSPSAPPPELRTLDGISFLVQKRKYLIFPQQAGDLTVPPLSISLPAAARTSLAAARPDGGTQPEAVVQPDAVIQTESLKLHADIPQGSGDRLPLVATNVVLERTVEGTLKRLCVGDAFSVVIRLRAQDTSPLLLPALELPAVAGLARYPGEGHSSSQSERGIYQAERVSQATYVASGWGFFELPEQRVFWLDPSTGRYAEATAPAIQFRARINPSLGLGCLGDSRAAARVGGGLGALALTFGLIASLLRGAQRKRKERALVHRGTQERQAFAELCRAARQNKDAESLTALYRWLSLALGNVVTLEQLRHIAQDEKLTTATLELEARLAVGARDGHAESLLAPLRALRKSRRRDNPSSSLAGLNRS